MKSALPAVSALGGVSKVKSVASSALSKVKPTIGNMVKSVAGAAKKAVGGQSQVQSKEGTHFGIDLTDIK